LTEKDAFAALLGPVKRYTGASVTNKTLSHEIVCGELLACAKSGHLTMPAVLASMQQIIVQMRAVDEDKCRVLKYLDANSHASTPSW